MSGYVRRELPSEEPAVARVVAEAFARGDQAVVAEVQLVAGLRDGPAWLPALSLVAVVGGEVVAHALGSRMLVGGSAAVALAPVAVLPSQQRSGLGSATVERLLAQARGIGETLVVVLGDTRFYSRFGFGPAADLGIIGHYAGDAFQALRLAADAPVGTAVYPAPFEAME